jgi:uncharacterized membrane protein YecN with MAPEG domain
MDDVSALPLFRTLRFAATYIALLALMQLALTFLVIRERRAKRIGLGDGGEKQLLRVTRMHGNFAETVPMGVVFLLLLPLLGGGALLINLIGLLLVTGRALHAYGLWTTAGSSVGRVVGMVMTFTAWIVGAGSALVLAWM